MHFRGEALTDPKTYALSLKVRMEKDDNPNPNALVPQEVSVRLNDGTILRHAIDAMLASPARPLSREDQLRKFHRCWSLSAEPLGSPEAVIALIDTLEDCADVRQLIACLAPS
jgi:2-methylcitrate dehydratase PrpD